ncbi:MAG: hypothetical protein HYX82_02265 [Chloroflexi bacterium]|nr:hypothetical protein [Chloroflexota bacterium]
MNSKKLAQWRFVFSVFLVSVVVLSTFLIPAQSAKSLTAIIRTAKQIQGVDSTYQLGETVVLQGEVGLAQGEIRPFSSVTVNINHVEGTNDVNINLPLIPGLNQNLTPLLPTDDDDNPLGTLFVDVIAENLLRPVGYGFNAFEGGTGGGTLKYVIRWTPPINLYPPPVFTLIPAYEEIATIPTLTAPSGPDPSQVLPNTVKKFDIPSIGAAAGTVLPNADLVGNIPQLSIPSTAPAELPDLPDTTAAFDVPTIPVAGAPVGVPELPDTTPAIDIPLYAVAGAPAGVPDLPDTTAAFDIPTLTLPTAPSGVLDLPDSTEAFITPGNLTPRGLAFDGTYFWVLVDANIDEPGAPDKIYKLDSSGNVIGGYISGPSDKLEGIAYLNGSLWVLESMWRCWDGLESRCDRQHRVFKINPSSPPTPTTVEAWFTETVHVSDDPWADLGGITAEGSGSTGTLWLSRKTNGDRLYNISQTGDPITSPWTTEGVVNMNALTYYNGFLYTARSGTITRWTTGGVKSKDFITSPTRGNIQGMTIDASTGVLYFAGATDKKVYKAFIPVTVTKDPRGIALQTAGSDKFLWLLVDGDPKDKLLKINASDNTLVTTFGQNGGVDAPSSNTEGIVYLSPSLWIITNDGNLRRLFKVNPADGAVQETFDLWSSAMIGEDLGDITTDGTDLVVYAKSANTVYVLNPTDASRTDIKWPGGPSFFGAGGLAYHSERQQYLFAKSGKVGYLGSNFAFLKEQNLTVDGTSMTGIQGMVFDGAVLYVARPNKISKGALVSTVTTNPRGIAFQQDTSTKVLWILVDGDPKDKLLKVNADTGAFITAFGSSGAVDAPSDKTEGIAFDGTSLWIVANDSDGRKLFKVRASDGALQLTFDLWTTASIWEDLGGIDWDGTNLVLYANGGNHLWTVNTSGEKVDEKWPGGPSFYGANGLGYHSGRSQLYAAKSGKVAIFDSSWNFVRERNLTVDGTAITGVQGLAFDGDVLYVARAGRVSKGALLTTITTDPRGIAFSPSGSTPGRALWIVVDGDPNDKLMKVDPDSGLLISTFGTNGAVDLPGNNIQGVVFLNNKLWVFANDTTDRRNLIRLKSTDGTVEQTFNLSVWPGGFVWEDVGDISTDGTNLILYSYSYNRAWVVDTSGEKVEEKNPCCPSFSGAKGVAYHSGRSQVFAGSGGKVAILDSAFLFIKEQTLTVDEASLSGLQGLVFDGDVLYVARSGKVSKGALREIATTNPRGIAYTPAGTVILGTPVGEALWVLVDGDPKDKLLKLDKTTLSLLTDFSGDGAIDAPSGNTEGITYLSNALWIIANDPDGRKLFKVRPTDGAIQQTFNMSSYPSGFINDDIGGITTDGTNLFIYIKTQDHIYIVNTSGERQEDRWMPYELNGANGLAYRTAKSQLFVAKTNKVLQLVQKDSDYFRADLFTTTLTDIQGMTFADDVLYMAHSGSGQISKASVPSEISNSPRGLAYDSAAQELYILVDGKGRDHIIVVNPTTGAVIRDFPAPDEDAEAITYVGDKLYVAINDDDPCCSKSIKRLNPNNGTELASFGQPNDFWMGITGMANDGQNLIATQSQGTFVTFIDPSDGSRLESRWFFPTTPGEYIPEGFQALAYAQQAKHFWTSFAKKVFRFDEFGAKLQEFNITTTGVDNIRGATFVGDSLYLAEAGGKTIQSAGIPRPPVVITNEPRAMATDGTNLYVAVEASPRDKIIKMNVAGTRLNDFDSAGKETDGLAYLTLGGTGYLYALLNDPIRDPQGFDVVKPRIAKMNPDTGVVLERFAIQGYGGEVMEQMGGLASDGQYLYATSRESGNAFRIDPNNLGAPAQQIQQFAGILPFLADLESAEVVLNRLVVSGAFARYPGVIANKVARMDKDTGVMRDQFDMGNVDIRGSAYIGINLYMADALSGKLLATILPDQTPELTVVGTYDSQIIAEYNPSTTESEVSRFAIERNPEVKVRITSPDDNFVTPTTATTVRGLVNDYALTRSPFNTVRVGVQLPFTTLFEDNVASPASADLWTTNGLWHIACQGDTLQPKLANAPCAWRYGRQNQPNFDTGSPNAGEMTLRNPIMIGPGTQLSFSIWYDTEPSNDKDKKTLEIAEVTKDVQGNDVVGPFKPVRQIVGLGFSGASPPAGAHSSFQYVELTPARFDIDPNTGQGIPSFFDVFVNLAPFEGKRIKARFKFDSVDRFGNSGEGVYIDRIRLSGSGAAEQNAVVTPLDEPVTVGSDTYVGEFQVTNVALGDGSNTIYAKATQPYSPFNYGTAQVSGSVDATPPFVSLFNISPVTSTLIQTLRGTVADTTFQLLQITQTNRFGTRDLGTINTMPAEGQFSMPVFLAEGTNTFEAVASDGSGLETTTTLTVRADTTRPSIVRATMRVPVGEVAARQGDQIILDVEVSDADASGQEGSGVTVARFYPPGETQGEPLMPASEIPQAIRDRFQITGDFVLFGPIPSGTPPGTFAFTIDAIDAAGNVSDRTTAEARVVATLEQFNRYLMPGINFISTPLQCTGSTVSQGGLCSNDGDLSFDIAALLQQVVPNANPAFDPDGNPNTPVRLSDVIETITAYDGGTSPANFKTYTTDSNSDTLTKIQVLRGYVVKTRSAAFKTSAPLPGFTTSTPAPIKITFIGSVLRPGDLPPIQDVVGGWNLIALHSENSTKVERFLSSVSVPVRKWASLFTFVNALNFTPPADPEGEPTLEIILGAFKGKFEGDMFDPGDGAWLYMVEEGVLVPVLQ